MPEIVRLKVDLQENNALAKLQELQKTAQLISGTKISFSVDTKGVEGLSKEALKLATAQAKLATEQAKLAAQQAKADAANAKYAREQEKTAQAIQKTTQEQAKAQAANEKTRQSVEKSRQEALKFQQAQEKTTQTVSKSGADIVKAQQETAQATEKTYQQALKVAQQHEKNAGVALKDAAAQREYAQSADQASASTERFNTALSTLGSRLKSIAFSELRKAMNDALGTMKAVDSELVTVRKVTGFNEEQLDALEEQAYKTGSALGTTADSYLSAAAEFARAGYKEQIADLAELSAKTQLVGDMSAKTANQFLISVDAAYKLGGSVEELNKIIDGANEIDNNYATTMEKLAEGMGIVAPVAAQVGVDVDQLSAALGTITAVTQRSGSEAARALRALMLNIIGDTKTEIEDGAQWTAGEIEGLRDVLRQYIPDVMAAADATGELIDPMEAIGALAQAYKEGTLNAQELMEQVTDISGKLRSSQLLALIQNWDMYESMLGSFTNAVGSADKEVENALTGWDAKINILKNTWAEFVSNTIDTDWIKGLIDSVTKLISGFGDLGTALAFVGAALAAIKLKDFVDFVQTAITSVKGFATSLTTLGTAAATSATMLSIVQAAAVALVAVIAGIVVAYNNKTRQMEEDAKATLAQAQSANEAAANIIALKEAEENAADGTEAHRKAIDALCEAMGVERIAAERTTQALKNKTKEELEQAKSTAYAAMQSNAANLERKLGLFRKNVGLTYATESLAGLNRTSDGLGDRVFQIVGDALYDYAEDPNRVKSAEQIVKYYNDITEAIKAMEEEAEKSQNKKILETSVYKQLKSQQAALQDSVDGYKEAAKAYAEAKAMEAVYDRLSKVTVDSKESYDALTESIKDSDLTYKEKQSQIEALAKIFPEYAEQLDNAKEKTDELEEATSSLEEAFSNASERIKAVADALGTELDEDIQSIADIFNAMSEAAANGYYNSNAFKKSADLIFSDEVRQQYADDAAGLMEYAAQKGYEAYFAAVEEGDYAGALKNLFKSAGEEAEDGAYVIRNKVGEIIASVKDVGDKTEWSFNTAGQSIEDFIKDAASAIGVSETVFASAMQSMGMYTDAFDEYIAKEKIIKVGVDADDAQKRIEELRKDLDNFPKSVQTTIRIDYSTGQLTYDPKDTIGHDQAEGYNRTQRMKQNGYTGKASGKRDSYSGLALVNDERPADGSKPELIVNNRTGSAYVANHGKPAIVNLSADDMVLTAAETKNAFGGVLPAFAGGNDSINFTTDNKKGGSSSASSSGGSSSGSTSSKNPDDILSEFREWVNWYKDKAKEEADKRQEEIDAQIDALKASKEAQEEADKLLELQLAVEEAQKNLLQAQVERTVRYYNEDTKQWEWMADQKAVASAQEKLDDAQKKLDDFKAEQEYQAILDGLQAQKDAIQAQYDATVKQWEDILKTMEAPARGITEILQDMQNSGVPALKEAAENVGGVLDGFTEIIYGAGTKFDAAINEAVMAIINAGYKAQTAKTETKEPKSSSGGGGRSGNTQNDWDPTWHGQNVSGISEVTKRAAEAKGPKKPGTAQLFDEGGIASGSGYMPKGAVGDEVVIGPSITKDVLSPVKNAQFMNFTRSIRALVEAGTSGNKFSTRNSSIANTNNSRNYYINGVKIGADMANKPMSQVLSTLSIYANESM